MKLSTIKSPKDLVANYKLQADTFEAQLKW